MQRIKFELGETRHVQFLIKSANNKPFTIQDATWQLKNEDDVEAEGKCTIMDHVIDALISPNLAHVYKLRIAYRIADETLIEVIEVAVT